MGNWNKAAPIATITTLAPPTGSWGDLGMPSEAWRRRNAWKMQLTGPNEDEIDLDIVGTGISPSFYDIVPSALSVLTDFMSSFTFCFEPYIGLCPEAAVFTNSSPTSACFRFNDDSIVLKPLVLVEEL
jgi:hypothetical protein